ncbi:O-antigen ligase family protein [Cytobacillus stercorigallinarum]|uniref:O-antigen ligase family protein n=1 Tax=Cytobacillus stercorigallinarum TaxID=2762240 RepID=UPI0021E53BCC|nr:O-antigen ligase family protein [Cytobacillus stercorigallinarum]
MGYKENELNINSILLALFISINMLTKIITTVYNFNNNIVIITSLILGSSLIYNKFKINKLFIFINLIILLLFFLSMLRVSDHTFLIDYLLNYIIYGLTATYLISFKVDFAKVTSVINLIFLAFTIVLFIEYIPKINSNLYLDFTMDLSYTSMIGISSVLLSSKYWKGKLVLTIINLTAVTINLWYLLILSNNRGAIVSLFILLLLVSIKRVKNNSLKFIIFISAITVISLILMNIKVVLLTINNIVSSFLGTRINWLDRFLFQIDQGDILTGRAGLYNNASVLIEGNPIFGVGIGYFELFNNGQYPHNIFIQLFTEFGVLIASVVSLLLIVGLYMCIASKVEDNYMELLRFFFILSIPRLMLSTTYWKLHFFWLFIFLCILILRKKLRVKERRV